MLVIVGVLSHDIGNSGVLSHDVGNRLGSGP